MRYEYNGKRFYPIVEMYHDVIPHIAGITDKEFYTEPEKCVTAWKKAIPAIDAFFGDFPIAHNPAAPSLSYGHLVSLGAPLSMPEEGEPNVRPFAASLEEGIEILKAKKGCDFFANPTAQYYIAMNKLLQERFPEYKISPVAGYGYEGIITTAVLMRGQDFLCDLYDDPDLVHEFLELLNESIIDFVKAQRRMNGQSEVTSVFTGCCDDFASLIPPYMWEEFVVPYWKAYYDALSDGGTRFMHCENVYPEQLRYLRAASINRYQPSVAERLTIENVRENTDVQFDWLLYTFRIVDMTDEEIEAWVDETVRADIWKVRTQFGKYAWSTGKMDKLLTFVRAFDKYRVE